MLLYNDENDQNKLSQNRTLGLNLKFVSEKNNPTKRFGMILYHHSPVQTKIPHDTMSDMY